MNISPIQLRAARAMLVLNEADLARHANKPSSTIQELERLDRPESSNGADLNDVRRALEQMGIEFIPYGVRLLPALTAEQQALFDRLSAISRASAIKLRGRAPLTDDDLYDENGLPA